jgi:low temperature requirement protein LtrA
MRDVLRSAPRLAGETHRTTTFEIFFDLVFVFALTQIISFMAQPPTPLALTQGLILLLLLWVSWTTYAWLTNQTRADVGLIRDGMTVAMGALLIVALVIPDAWQPGIAAVVLAVAYIVVRAVLLVLLYYAEAADPHLRTTGRLYAIPTTVAWVPLILGAVFGGNPRTILWAAALVIDFSGGLIAAILSGWRLRSVGHFTERHGLVLIIALGESLLAAGIAARPAVTRWPVLVAALLGLITGVSLWRLYFEKVAPAAGQAVASMQQVPRAATAGNAYSRAHFLLIAGVIYLALGIEQVIGQLAHRTDRNSTGAPLDWASTTALYGGAVLYLTGRIVFLRLTIRHIPPAHVVAAGIALLLLPAARHLPALAALGLLAAFLVALVWYERPGRGQPNPTASG